MLWLKVHSHLLLRACLLATTSSLSGPTDFPLWSAVQGACSSLAPCTSVLLSKHFPIRFHVTLPLRPCGLIMWSKGKCNFETYTRKSITKDAAEQSHENLQKVYWTDSVGLKKMLFFGAFFFWGGGGGGGTGGPASITILMFRLVALIRAKKLFCLQPLIVFHSMWMVT